MSDEEKELPCLDAAALTKIWQQLIQPGRSYVLFENGTCVVVTTPGQNLETQAIEMLKASGPTVAGTTSGDFNVGFLDDNMGWIIYFSSEILTFVSPDEVGGPDANEIVVGLLGRAKRDLDISATQVIHLERSQ